MPPSKFPLVLTAFFVVLIGFAVLAARWRHHGHRPRHGAGPRSGSSSRSSARRSSSPPPPPEPPSIPPHLRCVTDCDLVLAHCTEDVDWVIGESKRYARVFLYSKCVTKLKESFTSQVPNLRVIPSPNVGSNDYAILHHVIDHYDDLAPLSVFCEAGWDELGFCSPDQVVRPAAAVERYKHAASLEERAAVPYWPVLPQFGSPNLACLKQLRRSCRTPKGRSVGLWADTTAGLAHFSMIGVSEYKFQHTPSRKAPFVASGYPNYGTWLAHMLGGELASHLFDKAERLALGGYFSAERANLRRYPIEVYRGFAAVQQHPNAEVDHFIERSWGLLLTAPSALHLVKGDTGSCAGRTPSQQPAWWSACMHRNACSRFSKLLGCAASRLRVVDAGAPDHSPKCVCVGEKGGRRRGRAWGRGHGSRHFAKRIVHS